LDNGLRCENSELVDPKYVSIGNQELIDRRRHRAVPVPPGGKLSDYIPFYFTPFSPMMYKIKTGHGGITKRNNDEIVILTSSLRLVAERGLPFLFTDRHAYLSTVQFFSNLDDLSKVDWAILQARDFRKDDVDKFERYQAEALVYQYMPIDALLGIVCNTDSVAQRIESELRKRHINAKIAVKRDWYF
jgi:hypothetical protein